MATEQQTTPAAPGVEQQTPSVEDRLVAFYAKAAPRRAAPAAASAPVTEGAEDAPEAVAEQDQTEAPSDASELTPDDLPDEDTAAAATPADSDAFEIVHNGQQHKLSRAETIRLAQQGFDYTQKTQALAEQHRQVHERLQRVSAIEQVHPQLQQAQGAVQAMGAQLAQFQNVDWVALATNDPLEYSKVRARYDVLQNTYQQASQQYQTLAQHIDNQRKAINAEALRVESQKLTERIEEWKDPAKYQEGAAKLRSYLIAEGASPDEVDGLSSSLAVSIAWKAMRYDELRKSKQAKVKQMRGAPPMTKPGAAQTPQSAGQRQINQERARLKESGDWRDAARLLAKMK